MPVYHPRKNDSGKAVAIREPTMPSGAETWLDPQAVAVFVPDGPAPPSLCGIAVAPAALPTDPLALAALGGSPLADPPLPPLPGSKARSAGAVVVEPDGRVWAFEPTNRFGGTRRTFPKGRAGADTDLRAVAVREVFEESGLLVALGAFLADAERSVTVPRYYLARRVGGTPAAMGWEAQAVLLLPRARLAGLLSDPAERPIVAALLRP